MAARPPSRARPAATVRRRDLSPGHRRGLGAWSGGALYVGAVLGPGVLLLPGLALAAAGPASIVAWIALIAVSGPLAATFVALGVRRPVADGAAQYVREAFGAGAGAMTGWWFLGGVAVGAPAVALIGGFYVAELTSPGHTTAVTAASGMYACVIAANAFGIRASARLQLGMVALLVVLLVFATSAALPSAKSANWQPFAPHGWLAIGTAASLLSMSFVGWEAVAFMVGEFEDPRRDLPRAAAAALAVIAILYIGVAVAAIGVLGGGETTSVPLADLVERGVGDVGRDLTAAAAVLLTMGTINAYLAGAARLARAMADSGVAPAWLSRSAGDTPRRSLALLGIVGSATMAALAFEILNTDDVIRAISACFMAVYAAATAAGARLLDGWGRRAAKAALALVAVILAFSGPFLLYPIALGLLGAWFAGRPRPRDAVRRPTGPGR